MLKKAILLGSIAAGVLFCGGCEKCTEMTYAGPIEDHWNSFVSEDDAYSRDFVPSIKRWWHEEKSRWPKFRNKCLSAEDCYERGLDNSQQKSN